jgi:hypothetical protein
MKPTGLFSTPLAGMRKATPFGNLFSPKSPRFKFGSAVEVAAGTGGAVAGGVSTATFVASVRFQKYTSPKTPSNKANGTIHFQIEDWAGCASAAYLPARCAAWLAAGAPPGRRVRFVKTIRDRLKAPSTLIHPGPPVARQLAREPEALRG